MQIANISRILGHLLMMLSLTYVPPLLVEAWYQEGTTIAFTKSFGFTLFLGCILSFWFRKHRQPLRTQDGFLIVALFWLTASLVGALPFWLSVEMNVSFTNAFFESLSGITTTGSTILTNVEALPHALLYYRQQLQFIGGLSIIILAVAILPTLGIGGMQLFRTEITGPVKDDKLTPKITQSAKAMWLIYVVFTIICALCYGLSGMTWFDAIGHSFATVSTGGFSTHDAGLAYFASPYIKIFAILFMFLGGVSFKLHFLCFKQKQFKSYFQDPEFIYYVKIILVSTVLIWATLMFTSPPAHLGHSALNTLFDTVSFATTTGYISVNFAILPLFSPILLLFIGLIGGCASSTSGGIKVIRALLVHKQGTREIFQLIHPRGQFVVKLGNTPIGPRVIESIWGFISIYFVVFFLLLLLLLAFERDFLTAYSALITCISNTGPGLSQVINNFSSLSDPAKWVLSFAMLAGRLEIFTILVLLSPAFWRR